MVGCTCVFWWKNIFNFVRDNVCSTLYTYMHVVLVWGGIYIYICAYIGRVEDTVLVFSGGFGGAKYIGLLIKGSPNAHPN